MESASNPHNILVVDDDADLRAVLGDGLRAEGFMVEEACDRQELFGRLDQGRISLITLDVGLGAEDGFALAREVRAKRNVPIVMISGRGTPVDRVVGFECGADDYIVKPFHVREAIARIRRVLRRYELELMQHRRAGEDRSFSFRGHVLDTFRRELRRDDGSLVDLTDMEFRLLELFVLYPERVVSRDEIARALRGREWSPNDRTIDGHIARLRRKIEPEGEAPQIIKSVRGVGYAFTG